MRIGWKRGLAIATTGGSLLTWYTLRKNNYDPNSLGALRLARAGVAAVRVGYLYKTQLYGSKLDPDSVEFSQLRSKTHEQAAHMILNLCCKNKGIYIKIGQHIGALDYLVPEEYVTVMRVLHSKAPQSTFNEVLNVLRQDLGRDPYEIFEEIEEKPLGAASLAQVHKAKLRKDGSIVAIKVQHPLVLRNSIVDMQTIEYCEKAMNTIFENFNLQWLVEESKRNLPKELDFRLEAENAEKAKDLFKSFKWVKIPRVYWDLTTKRVLTMEFLVGGQVNDLNYLDEHSVNRLQLTSRISELYAHMIFKHGFIHSDPHPGNILVRKTSAKDVEISLLDHGLYANLSRDFRWRYAKLWMAILDKNFNQMQFYCSELGVDNLYPLLVCMITGRTWNSINAGIDRVQYSSQEKERFQAEIPNLLSKINEVLLRVNRQMLLILKTNDLIRGIEHQLNTASRKTSFITMTRCCLDNLLEERLLDSHTVAQRAKARLFWVWSVFKLTVYSTFLQTAAFFRII